MMFFPTVSTGFPELDRLLWGGLRRPGLTVLAATDTKSASALALSIARNAARVDVGAVVVVFLGIERVFTRLLSMETGIDVQRLDLGLCTKAGERRIIDGVKRLSKLPIHIDDGSSRDIAQMHDKVYRLGGADLIIVDSLLVGVDGKHLLARSLKKMAQDLNVSVVAVSQLNRVVKMRPPDYDYRPTLSDLRRGEQRADAVVLIHRDDLHNTEEEWWRRHPDEVYPWNVATIIVAKQQDGPLGEIELHVSGERFVPFEDENSEEGDEKNPF